MVVSQFISIDVKKLKELGAPPGPFYKTLKEGDLDDIVELPNKIKVRAD
jgi:hypothetical protein